MAEIDGPALFKEALLILQVPRNVKRNEKEWDKTFRSFFGCPPSVGAQVWNKIMPSIDRSKSSEYRTAQPKHLLYGLLFLKVYGTSEDVHCRIVGWVDRQTFRKWSWYFIEKIHDLEYDVIKLDNRFFGWDGKTTCLMSVDGTHCPINEPWPFSKKWYSEKLNGPGVTYEVGVCIKTGFIVWVNGPFVASTNDSAMFKETLTHLLADDEGVECDRGYTGDAKLKSNKVNQSRNDRLQKSGVRGRHEIVNSRLKIFDILNSCFHHLKNRDDMMEKHCWCFKACAVITQLKMEAGESLYDVQYDVEYL